MQIHRYIAERIFRGKTNRFLIFANIQRLANNLVLPEKNKSSLLFYSNRQSLNMAEFFNTQSGTNVMSLRFYLSNLYFAVSSLSSEKIPCHQQL